MDLDTNKSVEKDVDSDHDLVSLIDSWVSAVLDIETARIKQNKTRLFSTESLGRFIGKYTDYKENPPEDSYCTDFARAFFTFCASFRFVQAQSAYEGSVVDDFYDLATLMSLMNEGANLVYVVSYEKITSHRFELLVDKYAEAMDTLLAKSSSILMYTFSDVSQKKDSQNTENEYEPVQDITGSHDKVDSVFNKYADVIDLLFIEEIYSKEAFRKTLESMASESFGYISELSIRDNLIELLKDNGRVLTIPYSDDPKSVVDKVNKFLGQPFITLAIDEEDDFSDEYDDTPQIQYKVTLSSAVESVRMKIYSEQSDALMERINELLAKTNSITLVGLNDYNTKGEVRNYCKCDVKLFEEIMTKSPELISDFFTRPYKTYSPIWEEPKV